jgi:hypothetical protein
MQVSTRDYYQYIIIIIIIIIIYIKDNSSQNVSVSCPLLSQKMRSLVYHR